MEHASKGWPEIRAQLEQAEQILLLCDYDGTLAPITLSPQDAVLSPKMKQVLSELARSPKLTLGILSGRPLAQIKRLVGLKKIIYAGNHGLEIACAGAHFIHPKAARSRPLLTQLSQQLKERLEATPGAIVEDKGLTLSVHYRRVMGHKLPQLKKLFAEVIEPLKAGQKVKLTAGKKVWEVRPPVAWDKGQAVLWIIKKCSQSRRKALLPIYLGDDATDEDAFQALRDRGIAIRVGRHPQTQAMYFLRNVAEVEGFLRRLSLCLN